MNWIRTQAQPRTKLSHRVGIQLLMFLLFFYFSCSGASELGILSGIVRKFEGHLWLGRIMGAIELFGGLALLRPDGVLGGACFLVVAMASAVVFAVINRQMYAAVECFLMLNICIGIAYWCKPKALEA